MKAALFAGLGLGVAVLGSAEDITEDVSFQKTYGYPNGMKLFSVKEDDPTWRGVLPAYEGAVAYRLSCFPKLADEYTLEIRDDATWDENSQSWILNSPPEFTYNSNDNVFTRTYNDTDVFSYTPIYKGDCPKVDQVANNDFVGLETAASSPPLGYENGPWCKGPIELVHVYIEPVNDAPVAAQGEQYLPRMDQVMSMNTELSDKKRRNLDPPYTMTATLEGFDVDGDTLTYSIVENPENCDVWITEGNEFKIAPHRGFFGEDKFTYKVDDCKGGGHMLGQPNEPCLSDTAVVLVQVEATEGLPNLIEDVVEMAFEDVPFVGFIKRQNVASTSLLEALRYEILQQPKKGQIVLHCDGKESFDPDDCEAPASNRPNRGELRMWYTYKGRLDFFGVEEFMLSLYPYEMEDLYERVTGSVKIDVQPVNDPPVISYFEVEANMHDPEFLDVKHLPESNYTKLPFKATDVDSGELFLVFTVKGTDTVPEGDQGKVYEQVKPGEFKEIKKNRIGGGLPMPNGKLDLYYQAPPRFYGFPLSYIEFYVSDGETRSQPIDAKVNVFCIKGHKKTIPEGSRQASKIGGECTPCAPGSISIAKGASTCSACRVGTYGTGGTSECEFCSPGTFNPKENEPMCRECPKGATSNTGSVLVTDCFCNRNFYGVAGKDCTRCPGLEGSPVGGDEPWTTCPHTKLEWPLPTAGAWVDVASATEAQPLVAMRTCQPLEACLPMTEKDDWMKVEAGDTCAVGYEGKACSYCSDGYYRLNGACETCPPKSAFGGYVFAFLLVVFLPILLKAFPRFVEQFAYIDSIIMYTQATSVLGGYDLNWPATLKTWMTGSSIFNLNLELLHLECNYAWDFEKKWTWTMVIPLILIGAIVFFNVLAALLMVWQRTKGRELRKAHPSWGEHWFLRHVTGREFKTAGLFAGKSRYEFFKLRRNSIRALLIFAHMAYCFVSLGAFELFDCKKDLKDGNFYLESAPMIQCYHEGTWNDLEIAGIICIIVYPVGIFLTMAGLLYAKRNAIEKRNTIQMMGFMVERFTLEHYWFELVFLARFLVYTGLTAADIGPLQATVCNVVVLLCAVLAEIFAHPYKRRKYQIVESVSLLSNFFTLLCGMIYLDPTLDPGFRDALTIINVITIMGTYVFFAAIMLKDAIPNIFNMISDYFKYGNQLKELATHDSLKATPSMKEAGMKADASLQDLVTPCQSRFLTPKAMASAVRKRKNEDVENARDLFDVLAQHVDSHAAIQDTVGARVVIEDALHPTKASDLIKRLSKRKLAENKELQEFIDDLFDVAPEDRGAGAITMEIERNKAAKEEEADDEDEEEEAEGQASK